MEILTWIEALGLELQITGNYNPATKEGWINVHLKHDFHTVSRFDGHGFASLYGRSDGKNLSLDEALSNLAKAAKGKKIILGDSPTTE